MCGPHWTLTGEAFKPSEIESTRAPSKTVQTVQTVKNLAPSKTPALSNDARVIPYSEKCSGDATSVLAGVSSASVRVSSNTAVTAGATSASIPSVQAC